jgi:hypothetical protein
MKMLRCLIQGIAPAACGALVLSLLAGDAMAAKKPVSLLWPNDAKVVVTYYPTPSGLGPHISVQWPVASDADHYRLTVVVKVKGVYTVRSDSSPVYGTSSTFGGISPGTYIITVTAYSDPDEAVAYSESLQAQTTVH